MKETDILIIGAGLTGLTTAYYLRKQGIKVEILERNNRIGGVIHTIREDGFVFETGPNTGVLSNPEIAELFEDLSDNCKLETANPASKRRLIWKLGAWHALPNGLKNAILTPLFSVKDKFRILCEPFRKRGSDPFETVADLVKRRMGRSYLDYAVDPFISGIYAGNPNYLVTRYALPKLYNLEQNYGSFIRGAMKKKSEPKDPRMDKATKEVFSAEMGLGKFIEALGKAVGEENILLNATEISVRAEQDSYLTSIISNGIPMEIKSAKVISTVDAQTIPTLFPFLKEEELRMITNLEYTKVMQVVLGFKSWNGMELNAFGGLVPSKEKRNLLGVLFTSSFFKNRTTINGALLSVFMGGARRPELINLSDEEVREMVEVELKEMLQLKQINPDLFRIFRYKRAIPQYGRSSKERLEAITAIQNKYPGLILAGGIRDGIGMADRVKQARMMADEIIAKSK